MSILNDKPREKLLRKIIVIMAIALTAISCQKKKEGGSRVALNFPNASFKSKASHSVGAFSINFANVCYLANVVGGSIPQQGSTCDVKLGKHSAFMKPGSAVEVEVPRGSGYRLEIYAYELATGSDPCPSSMSSALNPKLYLVGSENFSVDKAEVTVNITVADPGMNVITQNSMPGACTAVAGPGGPVLTSPGGYVLQRSIGDADGRALTSTITGHKLVLGKDGSK